VVTSVLRQGARRVTPFPDVTLKAGDVVLVEGDHEALDRVVAQAGLSVGGKRDGGNAAAGREQMTVEAVVSEHSSLAGWSARHLLLYERFNVQLIAVSRRGQRLDQR